MSRSTWRWRRRPPKLKTNIKNSLFCFYSLQIECFENKITPLGEPNVKSVEFKDDGTFACKIEVDVKPKIEPSGYVGIEVKEPYFDSDTEAENILTSLYEKHGDVEDREEIDFGYVAVFDYKAYLDEEIISEQDAVPVQVQEGMEPPFGENLIGMKSGETKEFEIELSEEFGDNAGKKSKVVVTVKNIFEKIQADNNVLIKKLGLEDEDALKQYVESAVAKKKEEFIQSSFEEQVVDFLIDVHEFEVPTKWVDDEMKHVLQLTNYTGNDENTLKEMRMMAERNVRRTFILDAIYETEKSLEVSNEELLDVINQEAERLGRSSDEFRKEIEKQGLFEEIFSSIKTRKIMNFLLQNVEVQKKEEVENE